MPRRRRIPPPGRRDRPALLLDGMGTLVTLASPAPRLVTVLRRRFGVTVTIEAAREALLAEIAHYRPRMGRGRDAAGLRDLRIECAGVLRDALPDPAALGDVAPEVMADVLMESLEFAAFPDAREALLTARRAGARIVVVSNWDVSLGEVLERVGLAPLLDGVVISATAGAAKPDPGIFSIALGVAGVAAERARHVGDTVEEDVAGARAAGVAPVLLRREPRRDPAPPGVPAIASLTELAWD